MEVLSYVLHRWLFHGLLWRIHSTHHKKTEGPFELNDLFSLVFGLAAVGLIVWGGLKNPALWYLVPIGVGISVYGLLYFVIHDLYTHKRFHSFKSDSRVMNVIRRAHNRHHQSIDKPGQEPYGLFLFDFELFNRQVQREKSRD